MPSTWARLVNLVIRPPRADYSPDASLPGGSSRRFRISGEICKRVDLILETRGARDGGDDDACRRIDEARSMRVQCSHYVPESVPPNAKLPCVIYLHGNSGSRCDAADVVFKLLPRRVTVFALDLGGSGLSDGEYVTLGVREILDVDAVVKHLRAQGKTSKIGLWGQSMGAVTALLYSHRDPSIAGIVLDSPFSSLETLVLELVETYNMRSKFMTVPSYMTKIAYSFLRSSIKRRAKFDVKELDPLKLAPESFSPALFAHGVNDDFISPKHGKALHEAYAGDKDIFNFEGDHNSARPEAFYEKAAVFFNATLHARGHDREEEDAFTFSHTRRPGHDASNTDAGALGRVHSVSRLDLMPPDHSFTGDDEEFGSPTVARRAPGGVSFVVHSPKGARSSLTDSLDDCPEAREIYKVPDPLDLEVLVAMGFDETAAFEALNINKGDVEAAVESLLTSAQTRSWVRDGPDDNALVLPGNHALIVPTLNPALPPTITSLVRADRGSQIDDFCLRRVAPDERESDRERLYRLSRASMPEGRPREVDADSALGNGLSPGPVIRELSAGGVSFVVSSPASDTNMVAGCDKEAMKDESKSIALFLDVPSREGREVGIKQIFEDQA